jgi:hypothetical protein
MKTESRDEVKSKRQKQRQQKGNIQKKKNEQDHTETKALAM